MRLYSGTSINFIHDTAHNQIAGKLADAFFRQYRYKPSPAEISSWRNSLRAISEVFQLTKLDDHGVLLEYQLPLTSRRLDCMICGRDSQARDNAVIIELKQWERCAPAEGSNLVMARLGGAMRETLHPSAQVGQYHQFLTDNHTAFHVGPTPINLHSCAYLHNYSAEREDPLFSGKFVPLLQRFPSFTADDVPKLETFLKGQLDGGAGIPVLQRVERSKYRPSKKLMEHVSNVIKDIPEYILLDEQFVVYDKVLACATTGFHNRKKAVIIVRGGPGTGKSVIAINLMGRLSKLGLNAQYATGSRAFTETLRKIIGTRGTAQLKYFNSYGQAELNDVDVLICDEAHRIRETSNSRYTRREHRSKKSQIQEIIDVAKVGVFFIDDRQIVRPGEVGSTDLIRETAVKNGCEISEHTLEAQFRCAGSDAFVNWIDNTLGIARTANTIWEGDENFDFRILPTPEELEAEIRAKSGQGFTARLTAGFCWPWSKPKPDGTLHEDVVIGDFRRPWNAKPEAAKLARGIPKASLWAHDPGGIGQVGCIYTAQGFEFDYVGVIVGNDLTYGWDQNRWVGHPEHSHDSVVKRAKEDFVDLIRNSYRVLLSRGLKGCYVCFLEKDTERFVRSRIEMVVPLRTETETAPGRAVEVHEPTFPFRVLKPEEVIAYRNCIPLLDLKIAAGDFSGEQSLEASLPGDNVRDRSLATWVALPDAFRPRKGLFVAQVVGESMNRRIPNGSWCLFSARSVGSRQGKVVIAYHREIADSEYGGHYTIKIYESAKRTNLDETWEHTSIRLKPHSTMLEFEAIELTADQAEDLRILAEFVAVIG